MHTSRFGHLFTSPLIQARFRVHRKRGWGISALLRELAGLVGLLGWLGVLFYLSTLFAAGLS